MNTWLGTASEHQGSQAQWLQVDVADFSGPDFKHVDNRYAALNLVQKG